MTFFIFPGCFDRDSNRDDEHREILREWEKTKMRHRSYRTGEALLSPSQARFLLILMKGGAELEAYMKRYEARQAKNGPKEGWEGPVQLGGDGPGVEPLQFKERANLNPLKSGRPIDFSAYGLNLDPRY